MSEKIIRMANLDDAVRILEIYNPYIENTCITFECTPVSLNAFKERMTKIMENFPFIVYELDKKIIGYAYASSSYTRAAYTWNCDTSIYLDEAYHDRGIGSLLYKTLFLLMKEMGYYNVYALVTSVNPISLAFHKNLGFIVEGQHETMGFKFGKWLGITRLVKKIGDFSKTPLPVKSIHEIDPAPLLDVYTN